MKTLVAYFSAERGTTAALAKRLAEAVGADLFEIRPDAPYTKTDLNYMNPMARCNREMIAKKAVPSALPEDLSGYDLVLLGFPIWYGCAPRVVSTFAERNGFAGNKVAAFATSGGSGIGRTAEKLRPFLSESAELLDARLFQPSADADTLRQWAEGLV